METTQILLYDLPLDVTYTIGDDQEEIRYNGDGSGTPFIAGDIEVEGVELGEFDIYEAVCASVLIIQIKQEIAKKINEN